MNRANVCLALCAAAILGGTFAPAHAATISGSAIFQVLDAGSNVIGSGSWVLQRNHVLDFEFTTDEGTWDAFDIGHSCVCVAFFPDNLRSVGFAFNDSSGDHWQLDFSFFDSNFGIVYDVGGVSYQGTAENGQFFAPGNYNVFVEVLEPGTLRLLAAGLFALACARQRRLYARFLYAVRAKQRR
jgi:hypothetical protein